MCNYLAAAQIPQTLTAVVVVMMMMITLLLFSWHGCHWRTPLASVSTVLVYLTHGSEGLLPLFYWTDVSSGVMPPVERCLRWSGPSSGVVSPVEWCL